MKPGNSSCHEPKHMYRTKTVHVRIWEYVESNRTINIGYQEKKNKKKGKLNITEEHPPQWKELEKATGSHSGCTLIAAMY